ncbi:MAG: STM4015 family protein [Flavobacteriales bacterium]|nr:STM4015 family protein [Flavobacteriales bacterium]
MNVELIYQDDSSNKFWKISVSGNSHTVTYGRVGTDGTSKTKEFGSPEDAVKDANKLVKAKKRKGYQEAAAKAKVIRDDYTLAGKPIKDFGSSFNPSTAVKVKYDWDDEVLFEDKFDKLMKTSNIAELDTLVIGMWDEETFDVGADGVLQKLIEHKDKLSGLKHLFIGDMNYEECEMSWIQQANYSDFYQHFPQLETFGVRGGEGLVLGQINLPNLKNLIIETGGLGNSVLSDIVNSNLQGLEHLEIWLGTEDYGCTIEPKHLSDILKKTYPNLKYLGLKNYHLMDALAEQVGDASIIKNIEVLDLSMGAMTDKGAEALMKHDALLELKHLNCRHHFVSKDWQSKLKTKFSAQNINLADEQDSEGGEWYFVEIGE